MPALKPRTIPWLAGAVVVFCTLAAFLNSLDGEFLMDDHSEIVDNPLMESAWPPWRVMFVGHGLPSRPLPYLTFAIDHASWGKLPFGYHLTNLLIHASAALSLFWLTWTTLASPRCRRACGEHAIFLAAAIATLWAVHPLHTQAVTYIYQRIESLAGMLCLLSLAMFAAAASRRWHGGLLAGSVVAAAAAMLSKETAVVLPLLVASYDWSFCGPLAPPAGRRRWYYAALCSTWLVLGVQVFAQTSRYHGTGVFSASPLAYFLTQPRVIAHYLRLAVWPTPQCFDPNWELLTTWPEILPALLCLTVLGLAVVYGLLRRSPWAWPGVVFLLALAPSSSFVPLGAVAEEYRMYLALAAVVAVIVLGSWVAIRAGIQDGPRRAAATRAAAAAVFLAITLLIMLTQARNRVYATPGGVWLDVIAQGRGGTRALWNLAVDCDSHHAFDAAIGYADQVVTLNAALPVYEHIVARRVRERDLETAERYLRHAIATQGDRYLAGDAVAVRTAAYLPTVLVMNGKAVEAERLAGELLEQVRATLGDAHRSTHALLAIQAGGRRRAGVAGAADVPPTPGTGERTSDRPPAGREPAVGAAPPAPAANEGLRGGASP